MENLIEEGKMDGPVYHSNNRHHHILFLDPLLQKRFEDYYQNSDFARDSGNSESDINSYSRDHAG